MSGPALHDRFPCSEIEEHQPCPLCKGLSVSVRYNPRRAQGEEREGWSYWVGQCAECDLFYRIPGIKVERVGDLYNTGDYTEFLDGEYGKSRMRKYRATSKALGPVLRKGKGRKLLDFGCGTGVYMEMARKRKFDVYGTDLSPTAVAVARKKHGSERVGLAAPPPIEGDGFDVITMWSVLAHIADPHDQLSSLRDLLAPGGRLMIYTVNANSLQRKAAGHRWNGFTRNHLMFWDKATLTRLATDVGFSDISFTPSYGLSIELGRTKLGPRRIKRHKAAVDRYDAGNMLRAVLTK